MTNAEVRASLQHCGDCCSDLGISVAHEHGAVRDPVIEILVAIDIDHPTAFGMLDMDRIRRPVAVGMCDATRQNLKCLGMEAR